MLKGIALRESSRAGEEPHESQGREVAAIVGEKCSGAVHGSWKSRFQSPACVWEELSCVWLGGTPAVKL